MALLTEFLALRAARAMGLAVPLARPLYLPPDFPWTLGTDEFDGIVQRSFGWNLGVTFIAAARPVSRDELLAQDPLFLATLAAVDSALANTDRSSRNNNLLLSEATGCVAIDFDACLFLRRAARGIVPQHASLWPDHVLQGVALKHKAIPLPFEALAEAISAAPPEWIEGAHLEKSEVLAHLAAYCSAWNRLLH